MYSTPPELQIERANTLVRLTPLKLNWKGAARMLPPVCYIFCLWKRNIKGTVARDLPMQLNGPTRCVEKYNRFAAAVHYLFTELCIIEKLMKGKLHIALRINSCLQLIAELL